MKMESISINGLRMTAHHGVLDQERRVGNEFLIDIRLDVKNAFMAMASDNLASTINYAEVVDIVKKQMSIPSKLIEHVAGRIRRALLDRYGSKITGGSISICKLAPPIAAQLESVSFTTHW